MSLSQPPAGGFLIEAVEVRTGKEHMDVAMVHRFLTEESYWSKGIGFELVDNSLSNSFCVGAFLDGDQIGFGRVITDYFTFGWFADFFVLTEFRGKCVTKKMLAHILEQPWSKRLRRQMLNTNDAHSLYRQFGFTDLTHPTNILELYRPDVHLKPVQAGS